MALDSLYQRVVQAEKKVLADVEAAERERLQFIAMHQGTVRKRAKEVLAETPAMRGAREAVERLQLRLELLRNIKMNWRSFQGGLTRKGMTMRINQHAHLQHLIQFLETGKGVVVERDQDEVDREIPPERELMTYEVQPTGAGKTGAFAIDVALMDVPSLTLVPFDSLLDQTKKDMVKIGGIREDQIGIVGGGTKEIGRKHTIATYAGHAAQMRKGKEYAAFMKKQCKLVICDEVHHQALGDKMQESIKDIDTLSNGEPTDEEIEMLEAERDVLSHLMEQMGVQSLKIGFTATPRGSQKHVRQYFPHCLGRVYHREMVEAGLVVPYRIVQCDGSVFAGELDGYLNQDKEAEILNREGIYGKLVGEYAEVLATYGTAKKKSKQMPMRGMAFCTNHKECEKFVAEAEEHGLRCRIVTGKEAKGRPGQAVIDEAVDELACGEIDLIVTVEKLATGFNREEINAIISARITSAAKTIQYIGRGARSHTDDKGRVKDHCLVFETNWTLKKNLKKGKKPLCLAYALAFNGENPEAICTMADGSLLKYDKPKTREMVLPILTAIHTPASWSALKKSERHGADFAGTGLGLAAIARLFDVPGDPVGRTPVLHALGRAIWPDAYGDPEAAERERIRGILTAAFTPASWAALKRRECEGASFAGTGLGLIAIGSLFGVDGNPGGNTLIRHSLGRAIWPDAYGDPEAAERERIRGILTAAFSPASWAALKGWQRQGTDFIGTGMGLMGIATLFGVDGDPICNRSACQALGRAIWPDAYGDPEAAERERIRGILTAAHTPASWALLNKSNIRGANFAGTGMGLTAISTLFGIDGNALKTAARHALGRAIWPDAYGDPEAAERERIRGILTAAFTPASWAALKKSERGGADFAGTSMGLIALTTLFGIKGNAFNNKVVFYALGRAIFGDHSCFDR